LITFTGSPLDRADHLRERPEALAAVVADPRARLLKLVGLDPEPDGAGGLTWLPLSKAVEGAELILLGFDDGIPHFAASLPSDKPAPARSMAVLGLVDRLRQEQLGIYAAARAVVDWHARHRFCAVSGHPTEVFRAGWGRRCASCGAQHFPRTDPVVIMLVEHAGRALIGRQPSWPARRYSALAGFVEPGESIEEAVRRETLEEAGVRVGAVRYVASQPWPFPSSLMIGCIAEAESDAITVDANELEDAIWVSREEVRAALAEEEGRFLPPPSFAIARHLLEVWLAEVPAFSREEQLTGF
jgi:NAD+ diphosphatase